MYSHIMTPVDLSHADKLTKAMKTTADLASHYGARVTFVGVTGVQPSSVAHTPEEFADKLSAFAAEQASASGIDAGSHAITAHDPAVELDHLLVDAAAELGADLIVAGTHVPSLFGGHSHGGAVATHTGASVMLVRG